MTASTLTTISQSETFYRHVAPNMGFAYLLFAIGIAGLAFVAARCFYEAFREEGLK